MRKRSEPAPAGKRWIYRRWVRDPKTGKRVYPKTGRCFKLLVDE